MHAETDFIKIKAYVYVTLWAGPKNLVHVDRMAERDITVRQAPSFMFFLTHPVYNKSGIQ